MTFRMTRALTTAPLLALSLALSGCGAGTYNPGMEPVHQPVVSRIDYALDVRGTDDAESRRVATWFESLNIGYGDRIAIDDPAPYGNGEVRDMVATLAARHGLLVTEGAPVTAGRVNDGMVRVVVSRMSASVPNCPDWSRPSQPEYGASTMSNYGCASATNLAAMIANPEDLVQGQEIGGGSNSAAGTRAIKTYREKKPTGADDLKNETTGGQ